MGPHRERQGRDHQERQDHRRVAEQRFPREDRQDLAHDPPRGQDEDVDLGVAEEPERVLPEQDVPALVGVEEGRPQPAVREEHDQPRSEHRRRQDHEEGLRQDAPNEDGQARHRHTGSS